MDKLKAPELKAWLVLVLMIAATALSGTGCKKNAALEASDSDANGFVCSQCGAKLYSSRDAFPFTCPKCKQGRLVEVVGYYCEQDQHLNIVEKTKVQGSGTTCEKCGRHANSLRLPREKDLQAWGATKASS